MIKLLYIATNLNTSGGVARVLAVKLNYLVEEYPYEIHILNTHGGSDNLFFDFNRKIKIHELIRERNKIKDFISYKGKLNKKIKVINPDIIINCDNGLKGALLPLLLKDNESPLIYENHNSKNARASSVLDNIKLKLSFFIFSLLSSNYRKVIVYRLDNTNKKTKNYQVIPNPIGFNIADSSSTLNNKVAIAVGRVSYQKGYDKLMKIWALVCKKHSDWNLHIYGEGDNSELIKLAKKLGIISKVQFYKPVKDIKSVYLDASILLNTSRYEPFGLAVTEAMACGLPVVAFENTQGPKSYINDGENGFLAQGSDYEDYANKVGLLIENKEERRRISKSAKDTMKAYELNKIMKQWHDVFQSI
ncbi:glycosyltransferase [Hyunsoonleella pacifica]|uniref:Glycosyltransferase family 4 protein n=1 Tax=Hyunsoonleella pacifica TaxID=1080224 RepID=A0A4Q9FKM9_9FLAO|nr:glycosyltransferase [Hyunsoonleella pacifica]TBN13926.1 glycosyltransferase family 4 protein [Hyunsoonleella pacifica]GGD26842.1 glycosyl transferase [Hyunsoonleella pacifica]